MARERRSSTSTGDALRARVAAARAHPPLADAGAENLREPVALRSARRRRSGSPASE